MTRDEIIFLAISAAAAAVIAWCLWRWDAIRPDSFPPRSRRDVAAVPTVVWLLAAMLVYLGQVEGAILAMGLPASLLGAPGTLRRDALVSAAGHGAGLLIGGLMIYMLRARTSDNSGLTWKWPDLGRGMVAIVLLAPIYICASYAASETARLVQGAAPDKLAHSTLKQIVENRASIWAWVMIATAVIGAPIVEEIMYRALLQSCLLKALGRTWPAIIGTSAIFAAMHVSAVPAHALLPLFVVGLALGIAYERTRSLAVPITMHVLFNAGNVVVATLWER